jgi:hypothetical protein
MASPHRILREIRSDEARRFFLAWRGEGLTVDERVLEEIERRRGGLHVLRWESASDLLSLIWQETDPARLLTPGGRPRTLRDVATRLLQRRHSFDSLSRDIGLPRGEHHPEWFERCVTIDGAFEFCKFGWVVVEPPNEDERRQSPHGSLYLFDGNHRALVLAKRLLTGETSYQPVDGLLLPARDRSASHR